MNLIASILRSSRARQAWTLVEMMFAVATFSVAGAAVGSAYVFGLRSFQAVSNYAVLDQDNREAMDRITREIRSARAVVAHTNSDTFSMLTVMNANYAEITYTFDFPNRQLKRTSNSVTQVLLEDCHLLKFNLGVEAGQLAVAAVVFPLILVARRRVTDADRILIPALSACVAAAGGWWLLERVALT